MENSRPQQRRGKLFPADRIMAGFLEEVILEQLLKWCRIWTPRGEGRVPPRGEQQPPQHQPVHSGLCRELEQQEQGPGLWLRQILLIHSTNLPALRAEPQPQKWGSPTLRGPEELESGDLFQLSLGLGVPICRMEHGRGISEVPSLSTPAAHFPGLIHRTPQEKSIPEHSRMLDPGSSSQGGLKEAGRRPRLRAIKQLTAPGDEQSSGGSRETCG